MSEDQEKESLSVTLDLGNQGGQFVFETASDFHKWIDAEAQYWAWLQSVPPPGSDVAQPIRGRWKTLASGLKDIASRDLRDAVMQTAHRYKNQKWFHSLSPQGRFLESLRVESPIRAVGALAFFVYWSPRELPNNPEVVQGYIEAQEFRYVISVSEQARISSVEALQAKFQEEINEVKKQQKEWRESADANLVAISKSAEEVKERSVKSVAEVAKEYEEQLGQFKQDLKDHSGKLSTLEVTYESKLRLEAPVAYWKAKERAHKVETHKLQRWVAVYFIFGGGVSLLVIEKHLNGHSIASVPIFNISIVLFVVAIFIWAGRLLIRAMLSNMHLAADAHERYIMAQTYLALVKTEALNKENEKVALEALMRHSSDGIVIDDAAPWFDLLKGLRKP